MFQTLNSEVKKRDDLAEIIRNRTEWKGGKSLTDIENKSSVKPHRNLSYFFSISPLISINKEWIRERQRRVHELIRVNVAFNSENKKLTTYFILARDFRAQRTNC